MSLKEENLEILSEDEEYEDEEYAELDASEAIQEVKDELSIVSELLEQLVQISQDKLEQDKQFQDKLIAALEKLASR